jgi:hypothetical protein
MFIFVHKINNNINNTGTFYPKLVRNPNYLGPWEKRGPQIPNPEYNEVW